MTPNPSITLPPSTTATEIHRYSQQFYLTYSNLCYDAFIETDLNLTLSNTKGGGTCALLKLHSL